MVLNLLIILRFALGVLPPHPPPAFYTMMGEVVTLCWYGEMRVLVSVWIGLVLRGCLMSLYVLFAVSSSA